jgi:hypothetical protein
MDFVFALLFSPLTPLIAGWIVCRHGPIRNRWWRGENPIGFAFFVGAITFLLGFLGPMIVVPQANQGPLLGILYTGPIGLVLGLLWGLARALRRGQWRSTSAAR